MDPKKDPPWWRLWNWLRNNPPRRRSGFDKETQFGNDESSQGKKASGVPLRPALPQVEISQPHAGFPVRNHPHRNSKEVYSNEVAVLSAPKNARHSLDSGERSSSSSSSSKSTDSSSSSKEENDQSPIPKKQDSPIPSIKPHQYSKSSPVFSSFSKTSKNNKQLLKPRGRRSMGQILPVDDHELIEANELALMSWASRVHVSTATISIANFKTRLAKLQTPKDRLLLKASGPGLSELEISRKAPEVLEEGIQRTELLEEMPREDLFADVDAYLHDAEYSPYGFLITCAFQILWGLLAIGQTAIILEVKSQSEEFLEFDMNIHRRSLYLLMCSASYAVIVGVLGIIALMKDIPALYIFISNTSWLICAICLGGSLISIGDTVLPTDSTYYRIWESVVMYDEFPDHFKEVYPNMKVDIIERMQSQIRCCGMRDAEEWLYTPKHTIPLSCCIEQSRSCVKELKTWNEEMNSKPLKAQIEHLSQIKPHLYSDSCLKSLESERRNVMRDFIIYPTIYLIFYIVNMINFNYLIHVVQREYSSWEGISRMYSFRVTNTAVFKIKLKQAFCSSIPCCGQNQSVDQDLKELGDRIRRSQNLRMYQMSHSKKHYGELDETDTHDHGQREENNTKDKINDHNRPNFEVSVESNEGHSENPKTPKGYWSYKASR